MVQWVTPSNHCNPVPHLAWLPVPDLGPLASLLMLPIFPCGLSFAKGPLPQGPLPALFLPQARDSEIQSLQPWQGHRSYHCSESSARKMESQYQSVTCQGTNNSLLAADAFGLSFAFKREPREDFT